jgi:hypothetical protein
VRVPSALLHLKLTVGLVVLLGVYTAKLYFDQVGLAQARAASDLPGTRDTTAPPRKASITPPRLLDYLAIVQRALEARQKEDSIFEGIAITSVTVRDEVLTLEGTFTRERHRVDAREIAYTALTQAGVRLKNEGRNDHHRLKKTGTLDPDDTR